jgi:drug/metabolite transporter (DMT)-like permease
MRIFLALAAACFLGGGFVAQQHAAYSEPLEEILRMRLLAHLIRKPGWLLGMGAMVCGQILGALALAEDGLGQVEPLLATSLIFALVIGHVIYQERLDRTVWWGGLLVSGGTAVFLVFGQPHGGRPAGPESLRWLTTAVIVGIAGTLVLVALPRSLRAKAMLLAASAGMLYGVQDALTRGSLLILDSGRWGALRSWQPYALVGIATLSLLLAQSAFDAAPIRISLPVITAVEPVIGIVLGITVFSESLRLGGAALAAEVTGLLAMVAGITVLGRSPLLCKSEQGTGGGAKGGHR